MLCDLHITFIRIQIFLSKLSFSVPLEWDLKFQRLRVTLPKRKVFWILLITSTCVYISRLLLTTRVMYLLYQPEYQRRHNFLPYMKHQALNFAFGVLIFCCMQISNTKKRHTICELINSLINFEVRHNREFGAKISESLFDKLLIATGCISSVSCPILVAFLAYLMPCIPPLYGSLVLNCPDYDPTAAEMTLVIVAEVFTNLFAWTSGMWTVFISFFTGIICLKCFVNLTRSIPFTRVSCRMYTEVRHLGILFNSVHQDDLLPLFLVAAMICPSLSIFLCVGFHQEMPIPLLGFLGVVTFDGMFVILFYLFGSAGRIYLFSSMTVETWRHDRATQRDKLAKRQLKSLVPIKVRFGPTSFMDQSTCLVCVQFTVTQAASMLLAASR